MGTLLPVNGISYYINSPENLSQIVSDPIHASTYIILLLMVYSIISIIWCKISGNDKNVERQLKYNELKIRGFKKKSISRILIQCITFTIILEGILNGILTI